MRVGDAKLAAVLVLFELGSLSDIAWIFLDVPFEAVLELVELLFESVYLTEEFLLTELDVLPVLKEANLPLLSVLTTVEVALLVLDVDGVTRVTDPADLFLLGEVTAYWPSAYVKLLLSTTTVLDPP